MVLFETAFHMKNSKMILVSSVVMALLGIGYHSFSQAEKKGPDLPVIDVHTHTDFDGEDSDSKIKYTLEGYKSSMTRAGVVAAVSHSSRKTSAGAAPIENVIQCYGVGEKVNLDQLHRDLKSKKYRCIKIYLGYVFRYASDPLYKKLYKLAEKHDVPVVFHTGDTLDRFGKLKYTDPLTIDEVAVEFPKVTFVIAHLGNPWIESASEVAYKNQNVYIEGSALLIGDFESMSEDKIEEYVIKPLRWSFGYIEDPSKMMFGTDWPLSDMKPYIEAYKKAIPREYWCDVFYNNAKKVFKFDVKYECK